MPFRLLNFWVDRWYVCSILLFSCSHVYVQILLGLRAWEIRQLGHGHEWSPLLFPEISLFLDVCALRNSTRRICTLNGEVGVMEILGCCIFFWKDSLSHALNVLSPPYCCFVFRSSYYWEKNNLLIPFRWLNVTVLLSMIWYRCSIYSWEIFIGMPMDAWLGVFFSYHLKILKTRSCVPCFEPGQSWEFQHFPEFNCSNRSTTRGLTFILNFKQTPNEAPVKQQSYSCSWVVLYAHIRQKSQDMMLHIQLFLVFLLAKVSLFACEYIFKW